MKFKPGKITRLAGATALAVLLSAGASTAQEVVLKLHQFLPAQAPVPSQVLTPWIEKVEVESNGRIKVEHYPAMQLGGTPPELIDQVTDGVVDLIWTLPGYTPGRFLQSEVIELPFLMTDSVAASKTLWTLAEEHMLDTEYKDIKVLGMWVHGPGLIHSKDPITTPDDLKGVKMRAPTRLTTIMARELGAETIGMPVPAVGESLSKGVITAALLPWEVTASVKSSELVHNHTEFPGAPLYTSAFLFAMNKAAYDNLPDDLKTVIDNNSGFEFSANAGTVSPKLDGPARKIAEDLGNNFIELTPEQIDVWKAAAAPTTDAYIKELNDKGIDGQALVDEAKALMAKFTE